MSDKTSHQPSCWQGTTKDGQGSHEIRKFSHPFEQHESSRGQATKPHTCPPGECELHPHQHSAPHFRKNDQLPELLDLRTAWWCILKELLRHQSQVTKNNFERRSVGFGSLRIWLLILGREESDQALKSREALTTNRSEEMIPHTSPLSPCGFSFFRVSIFDVMHLFTVRQHFKALSLPRQRSNSMLLPLTARVQLCID